VAQADAGPGALAARATVLKAAGRPLDALAVNQQAVARFSANGVCWHNLASTLGDLGRAAEAEAAARRAIALGVKAPETRLVLGRALQSQLRLEEAEAALVQAVSARPDYEEAHRDLAQLIWMRTGDARAATARLEAAVRAHPAHPGLCYALALAHEFTGDPQGARAVLEEGLRLAPRDRRLLVFVVEVCCELGEAEAALRWAKAIGDSDQDANAQSSLAQALLLAGEAQDAARAADRAAALLADDQFTLAVQATAWRLAGDARYRRMYDYDRLVATYDLFDPDKAEDQAFLEALRGALTRLHGFSTHPFGQSVRGRGAGDPAPGWRSRTADRRTAGALPRRAGATREGTAHRRWPVRATQSGGGQDQRRLVGQAGFVRSPHQPHPPAGLESPRRSTSPSPRWSATPRPAQAGSSSESRRSGRRRPSRPSTMSSRGPAGWCSSRPTCGTAPCLSFPTSHA
jgi:tetratricopeptide (TPR) repeat protein